MNKSFPLNVFQKNLWLEWMLNPNKVSNNTCLAYTLIGELDILRFQEVINEIISNYTVFRTILENNDLEGYYRINDLPSNKLKFIDLTDLIDIQLDEKDYINKIINQPLELLGTNNYKLLLIKSRRDNVHYFIACFSHILIDSYGAEFILNEISHKYNNIDYSVNTENINHNSSYNIPINYLESAKKYWKNKLDNDFSFDWNYKKQDNRTNKTRLYSVIDKNEFLNFKKLCFSLKSTSFLGLMSIFSIVLSSNFLLRNFLIYYAVNCRNRDHKKSLSYFVNLLPMSFIDIDKNTFEDLLSKVTTQRRVDKQYQNYPLKNISEVLREKSSKYQPINIIFSEASFCPKNFELNNIGIEFFPYIPSDSIADIALLYDTNENGIFLVLEYNTSIFDEALMHYLMFNFKHVLNKVCKNPNLLINELANQPVKKIEPAVKLDFKNLKFIHQMISDKIRINELNGKIAIVSESKNHSYRELEDISNKIASYLLNLDLSPKARIAISLSREPYTIFVMLGIIKAGFTYVPLDENCPIARLEYIINDANVSLWIHGQNNNQTDCKIKSVKIEDLLSLSYGQQIIDLAVNLEYDDLVYIIYTSGSTGTPKGVPISHYNLLRLFKSTENYFQFNANDRWSLFHSFAFDFSVWEIWGALINGAELHILSNQIRQSALKTYYYIASHEITVFNQTPFSFNQFNEIDKKERLNLNLRYVIFGGEKLNFHELKSWYNLHSEDYPTLINMYGLTEATVHATFYRIRLLDVIRNESIIGNPLPDLGARILNENLIDVPDGLIGELYLSGGGITKGYINKPEINQSRFLKVLQPDGSEIIWFSTRDLVRKLQDGNMEYIGRIDKQIKLQGYRIELDEINIALKKILNIESVVTLVHETSGNKKLISFYISEDHIELEQNKIIRELKKFLPYFMIPSSFLNVKEFPLTSQGKLDMNKLLGLVPSTRDIQNHTNELQTNLLAILKNILNVDDITINDNFFDLGGNSIKLIKLQSKIEETYNIKITNVDLFYYTTVKKLAAHIDNLLIDYQAEKTNELREKADSDLLNNESIAIVGIAAYLPKANNINEFWNNLRNSIDGITVTQENKEILQHKSNFVNAIGSLDDPFLFDADFFRITSRDAERLDPQHRLILECAYSALEDANFVSEECNNKVGVFLSQSNIQTYLQHHNIKSLDTIDRYQMYINNNPDFLATRVSYKLNLTGPSYTVQSGCSSSLLAITQACQSLKNRDCDIALAGGATVNFYELGGYFYHEDMILSPDGRCRAFDKEAQGTVPGNGVVIFSLKRLSQALKEHDHIYAVIKGYAVNNDGSNKIGFTAPSREAQIAVVSNALRNAQCTINDISYIEAHGTGTRLGDSIELSALNYVYKEYRNQDTCFLGSVKSNVGHLDNTAGAVGLLKTTLCLKNSLLVPNLYFNIPNSELKNSHFQVIKEPLPWETKQKNIRRAGVSSFAVGGTNVHVIVEESRINQSKVASTQPQLIILSAKTPESLILMKKNLREFLKKTQEPLSSIAYTLQCGRPLYSERESFVCFSKEEAILNLDNEKSNKDLLNKEIIFIITDCSSEIILNFDVLYKELSIFRNLVDQFTSFISKNFHVDILNQIRANDLTKDDEIIHILLIFALAKQYIDIGIRPHFLTGIGIGTYVTFLLSEIVSTENFIKLTFNKLNEANKISLFQNILESLNLSNPIIPILSNFSDEIVTTNLNNTKLLHKYFSNLKLENNMLTLDTIESFYLSSTFTNEISTNNANSYLFTYLKSIKKWWDSGVKINWKKLHGLNHGLNKISLPTYPFLRKSYCLKNINISSNFLERRNILNCLYIPSWKYDPLISKESESNKNLIFLIIKDDLGISEIFAENLRNKGYFVVTVENGDSYFRKSNNSYVLNMSYLKDYMSLLDSIINDKLIPNKVLYCQPLMKSTSKIDESGYDSLNYDNYLKFCSFTQSLIKLIDDEIDLYVIINNLHKIKPTELIIPGHSLIHGTLLTLTKEFTNIKHALIDIDLNNKLDFNLLLNEFTLNRCTNEIIGYRNTRRYLKTFHSIKLPLNPSSKSTGTYLITGGLGSIGLAFAQFFAKNAPSEIILIQRSFFPSRDKWDQFYEKSIQNKLDVCKAIESMGSKVHIYSLDISDEDEVTEFVKNLKSHFGKINGIIHSAGIAGGALIHNLNESLINQIFSPKVNGIINIFKAFSNDPPDFTILCSSLSSITGEIGQSAYNSANAFLDSYSQWLNDKNFPTLSINWDMWKDSNMIQSLIKLLGSNSSYIQDRITNAIQASEAIDLMQVITYITSPNIVVSTLDLNTQINNNLLSKFYDNSEYLLNTDAKIQENIRSTWMECFGVNSLSLDNDFFELGGDSLLALQLCSLITNRINMNVTLQDLIQHSTLSSFTNNVLTKMKRSSTNLDQQHSSLLKIRSGTTNKNLFLIHPVGGTALIYGQLAKHVDSQFNVYGLQAIDANGIINTTETSVQELAHKYKNILYSIQPSGYIYVGGASFGGTIAYEIASQLQQEKRLIAGLIMIDTPAFEQMPKVLPSDSDILAYMLEVGSQHKLNKSEFYKLDVDSQLDYFLSNAGGLRKSLPTFDLVQMRSFLNLYKQNIAAMFRYEPKYSPIKTFYFKANERDEVNPSNPEAGWVKLLRNNIQIYQTEGNHITMLLNPHVEVLASQLNQILVNYS